MATFSKLSVTHLAFVLLSACATAPEPAGLSALEPVSGRPDDLAVTRSRWVGIGRTDACGLSWAFDLLQDGNKVSGRLLWETVRYDFSGTIAADGRLTSARAGKNPDFNGTPAPRFVIVNLEFGARRAVGSYAAETQGSNDCATAVELLRYAAD
jgi:hypothetical protein